MGYIHTTEFDFSKGRIRDKDTLYYGLIFDDDVKSKKIKNLIAEEYNRLDLEVKDFIKKKSKEFDSFVNKTGLVSSMGTIGKPLNK